MNDQQGRREARIGGFEEYLIKNAWGCTWRPNSLSFGQGHLRRSQYISRLGQGLEAALSMG